MTSHVARQSAWHIPEMNRRKLFLFFLLWLAVASTAWSLSGVVRELDLGLLWTVASLAVLLGWGLATWGLPNWLAGLLASLCGLGVVLVRVGRLGGVLVALAGAQLSLYLDLWSWLLYGSAPDWAPVVIALAKVMADVGILLHRGTDWLLALIAGDPAFDPVAVALVWSAAMWANVVWAGWWVRCRRPLLGLLPISSLLGATMYYAGRKALGMVPLLGLLLLLMALTGHDVREQRWRAAGIKFSRGIWSDLTLVVSILSLALMIVSVLVGSISMHRIVEWTRRFNSERSNRVEAVAGSLGVEQMAVAAGETHPAERTAFDRIRVGGLPRRHLIGSGPELSERVVMLVGVDDRSLDTLEGEARASPLGYYWRSLTYDWYDGRGWSTGRTEIAEYQAGQPTISTSRSGVVSPTLGYYRQVRQEVQVLDDLDGLLHVVGTLVTADHNFSVAWRSYGDAFGATIGADTYRADSLVPIPSEEQLRSAGSSYPEWVQRRYLALPNTIPARVLALARDLTATEPNPYDRARAIEAYLRTFPYTLDVSTPPYGHDVVDYFLFDLQEGYCDYYATAMVVLARAAGLPARMVIGYTSGDYDVDSAHYAVTEANAHAWPEVLFPGYGWVEFEPTASFPLVDRPAETLPLEVPEWEDPLEPASVGWSRFGRAWWLWLLGVSAFLILTGVVWVTVDDWRLHHLKPAVVVAMAYGRLQRYGRRLAVQMQEGDTPYEFARSWATWTVELRWQRPWRRVLHFDAREIRKDVHQLTDLYVRTRYSPRAPDDSDRMCVVRIWQRLRGRLWLVWLLVITPFSQPEAH
jgi:transglutaminase-like putative cysteine protease